MLQRILAASMMVALLTACSGGGGNHSTGQLKPPTTIVVDGQTIDVDGLVSGVHELCRTRQAIAENPAEARTIYQTRVADPVKITVRALTPAYSILAANMTGNAAKVDSAITAEPLPPTTADRIGQLAANMREGLARLAIPVPPCPV